MKNIKLNAKIVALALASGLSLTACNSDESVEYNEYAKEVASDNSDYDVLNTNDEISNSDDIISGVSQILNVNGETFKLSINYTTDEKEWRITSDKRINMEIKTVNLTNNKEVYIDNIHTDTSIVSDNPYFDGIQQDTMDDRIHNSIMMGFPINNNTTYYGVNEIEGQNQEFISGFLWGVAGFNNGRINERRLIESDFLKSGVYANKIRSTIDLIIINNTTGETRTVSVPSILIVEASNRITLSDGRMIEYDKSGKQVAEYNSEGQEIYDYGGGKRIKSR